MLQNVANEKRVSFIPMEETNFSRVYNKQLRCGSYNGVIKMYIKEKFYFLLIIASTRTNIKILIQEYCTNGYCFGLGNFTHLSKGSDRSPGFIALPTVDCCNTVCYHSPQCFVNSNSI